MVSDMKHLFSCRRTFIASLSITALTVLGCYTNSPSVSYAIASVAVGLAASNAYEGAR